MAWEHLITADAFDNRIFAGGSNLDKITRSTSYARTGSRSFAFIGASILSPSAYLLVEPAPSKYVAFSVVRNQSEADAWFDVMEGSTIHVRVNFRTWENRVDIYRGGGTAWLASIGGHSSGVMLYLDMFFHIHSSEGRVVIRDANGTALVDYTGNTHNGGSGVVNRLQWFSGSGIFSTAHLYLDDIAVRTDDFCGPGGNYVRTPVGAGADVDWTASAGQPFECVDEIPPTMADYILANSGSAGARATFQGSSPEGLAVIDTVGVYALAQLEFAGAGRISPVAKSGASYAQGEAQGVGTSETWIKSFFDADPGTAAPWSKNAVLASQFGVEVA